MNRANLTQLEESISKLPLTEQLWLIERLAQHIRYAMAQETPEAQLVAMANDPEIQQELRLIEEEFAVAETDGLEGL